MKRTRSQIESLPGTAVPSVAPTVEKSAHLTSGSPDTLAALSVNSNIGLTRLDVENRRKEYGYNEVAQKKGHPVLQFLGKF